MKIRKGFVSNSSSCSFVVIGYKIPKDYSFIEEIMESIDPVRWKEYKNEFVDDGDDMMEHWYEFCDGYDVVLLDDDELGYSNDKYMIVGKTISESDDISMLDETVVFINDLEKDLSKIKEVLLNNGIVTNTVLITGTKMC